MFFHLVECQIIATEVNVNIPTTILNSIEKVGLIHDNISYNFVENQAHIFEQSIRNDVKKKKGKLFAVFIDFKKAYDTVDRNIIEKT